jgi:hypothetical protein
MLRTHLCSAICPAAQIHGPKPALSKPGLADVKGGVCNLDLQGADDVLRLRKGSRACCRTTLGAHPDRDGVREVASCVEVLRWGWFRGSGSPPGRGLASSSCRLACWCCMSAGGGGLFAAALSRLLGSLVGSPSPLSPLAGLLPGFLGLGAEFRRAGRAAGTVL